MFYFQIVVGVMTILASIATIVSCIVTIKKKNSFQPTEHTNES